MKTYKRLNEALKENKISPDELIQVLEPYLTSLNQYLQDVAIIKKKQKTMND